LLLKRDAFCHEHEVRLIYVDKDQEFGNRNHIDCPVDANTLIEQITLDPRLLPDQEGARIEKLRDDGFRGTINKSELYSIVCCSSSEAPASSAFAFSSPVDCAQFCAPSRA
jgi:hypothetical protein